MKPFWQSKTLWFNLGLAVLGVLKQTNVLPANIDFEELLLTAVVGNAGLRAVTSQPVRVQKKKSD